MVISLPWPTVLGSHRADMERYTGLVRDTPALRTHEREQPNQLTVAVSDALTDRDKRSGTSSSDAEHWITATALVGLWSACSPAACTEL